MDSIHERPTDHALDQRICEFLQLHRRLTFLALANLLPAYSWRALFAALSRLQREGHIRLVPRPWNYEVVFVSRRAGRQVISEAEKPPALV